MPQNILSDLRYGWRSLFRQPLFTFAAAFSLALGIGACSVIFSVVYALLLKPLPYARPDELVQLQSVNPTQGQDATTGLAPAALADLQDAPPPAFAAFGGLTYDYANLTNVPAPEQLTVGLATRDYFRLYGVPAALGRTFAPDDCRPSSTPVAVLSNKVWRTQFHASPEIVGQQITLSGVLRTVIGVMPASFKDPNNVSELWLPLPLDEVSKQSRAGRYLSVIARLSEGGARGMAAARAALAIVSANQATAYPVENRGWSLEARPLRDELVKDNRKALWLLFGAVGCVLLVTCLNVANLQMVRASVRRRELGVRLALGASRGRLARQWLTESLLLAGLGGGLGALLAAWGVDAVTVLLPAGYSPRQEEIELNVPVLLFAAGTTGLAGLFFGLLPAWFATRQAPAGALAAGGRGASEGNAGARTRGILVVVEITLALVLLTGAGLMARSFYGLLQVPPGMRTERVLTLGVSLSDTRYPDAARSTEFYRRSLEAVLALPGVENVALSSTQPFNWWLSFDFAKLGQAPQDAIAAGQRTNYDAVNPGYFSALDVPIRRGRGFDAHDTTAAPDVAVVNEAFAHKFFPTSDPIGQKVSMTGFRVPVTVEIVGVAADVRRTGLDKAPPVQMYTCYLQRHMTFSTIFVRASTGISAESLTKSVQAAIWQIDPEQPISSVSTLDQAVRNSVGTNRLYLTLFMLFAGLTLALAALGIYGTVSYSVVQRTREIGIRLALGAQRSQVLGLVMGQAARLTATGVILGLLVALGLARMLSGLLFGVAPSDPATLACVALLLAGIALLASYLPARRAMRIDPLTALREE